MNPVSDHAHEVRLGCLILPSDHTKNSPNQTTLSSFDIVSVFPRQPSSALTVSPDQFERPLRAYYPHAHHHIYSFGTQDHAVLDVVRDKAGILRSQLLGLVRKNSNVSEIYLSFQLCFTPVHGIHCIHRSRLMSLQLGAPIILIAYDTGTSIVKEALAAAAREDPAGDGSVLQYVQGLVFQESSTSGEAIQYDQVYLPERFQRQVGNHRDTALTTEPQHGTTAPKSLSFGGKRFLQYEITMQSESDEGLQQTISLKALRYAKNAEDGSQSLARSCALSPQDKHGLILAIDAIIKSPGFQNVPTVADRTMLPSRDCEVFPASNRVTNPHFQTFKWEVTPHIPRFESRDVAFTCSEFGLKFLLAQLSLSWNGLTMLLGACRDIGTAANNIKPLGCPTARQAKSAKHSLTGKCRPHGSRARSQQLMFMPIKHGTWPVTRYDWSLHQRPCLVSDSTPQSSEQEVLCQPFTVNKVLYMKILAQFRLFLVLMSLFWAQNPDSSIAQFPLGSTRGSVSFENQNVGSRARQGTSKAPKRPMQESQDTENDRSKRVDVGVKDKGTASTDTGFPCPYYDICSKRHRKCWNHMWLGDNLRKLKEHLYKEHMRFLCNFCHQLFRDPASLSKHTHRANGTRDYVEGFDHSQRDELRNKSRFGGKGGQEYYDEVWKILFPHDLDRNIPMAERLVTRRELELILQGHARRERDRVQRIYHELIYETRSVCSAPLAMLRTTTDVFNRHNPHDPNFDLDDTLRQLAINSQPACSDGHSYSTWMDAVVCNELAVSTSAPADLSHFNNARPAVYNQYTANQTYPDEDGVYGDGGVALPPRPTTPHQPIPIRMPPRIDTRGPQSALMKNDFLDVPRPGEEWRYPYGGRDAPNSPSGFETLSSSSPLTDLSKLPARRNLKTETARRYPLRMKIPWNLCLVKFSSRICYEEWTKTRPRPFSLATKITLALGPTYQGTPTNRKGHDVFSHWLRAHQNGSHSTLPSAACL